MKPSLLVSALLLALPLFAHADDVDCPDTPPEIVSLVRKAHRCTEAAHVAEECALGSSADVPIAGAASAVCAKDYSAMNDADRATEATMRQRCDEKFRAAGPLAPSLRAFCELDVAKFWSKIYVPTPEL